MILFIDKLIETQGNVEIGSVLIRGMYKLNKYTLKQNKTER